MDGDRDRRGTGGGWEPVEMARLEEDGDETREGDEEVDEGMANSRPRRER